MKDNGIDYSLAMYDDGVCVLTWYSSYEREQCSAELDPNSADVKEALALIRKIVWGNPDRHANNRCPVDWGSATPSQRCTLQSGHEGLHLDSTGRTF